MSILEFSQYKDTLIELYSSDIDDYYESFSLGFIVEEFDTYVIFQAIDDLGALNSYQLIFKKYIDRIESETEYTKMYEFYINYLKKVSAFDPFELAAKYNRIHDLSFAGILNHALQNKQTVTVITTDNDTIITGEIVILNESAIVIAQLDPEDLKTRVKQTILKEAVISIAIISSENFLYQQYQQSLEP